MHLVYMFSMIPASSLSSDDSKFSLGRLMFFPAWLFSFSCKDRSELPLVYLFETEVTLVFNNYFFLNKNKKAL